MAGAKSVTPLSPLVWVPVFGVDEESLDRQHRKLMLDLNELTALLAEGRPWSSVVAKSEELQRDSVAHFEAEEEMLKKTAYPRLPQHRADHGHLVRQLRDIVGHLAEVRRPARRDVEATLYLRSMLIDHFFRKDIAYRSHVLNSCRAAEAPP
jgi:hemerythrin-like metal-binding protein